MRKGVSIFCSLALVLDYSAALASLFTMLSIVEDMENTSPGLVLWFPCLVLCHVGLGLFLRRERSIRSVIIFCGCFFALQCVAVFAVFGFFSSLVGVLAAICMWLFSYICSYDMSIKPLTPERLASGFDICSIVLVFLLFFCSVKGLGFSIALPLALTSLATLFSLVLIRGGEQRRGRSVFISAALVLGFALASLLVVALASGGIRKLLIFLRDGFFWLLRAVFRVLALVMNFIFSLFPQKDYDILPPELEEGFSMGGPADMGFEGLDPQLVMGIIIGLGLAIAAVMVIAGIIRGKGRVAGGKAGGEQRLRRDRLGLVQMLRLAMQRLISKLRFAFLCISRRNTAPGLFMQLERRSRPKLHGRSESESCREFICRAVSLYPHAEAELMRLAGAMDDMCFGGGDGMRAADIVKLRRAIFKPSNDE